MNYICYPMTDVPEHLIGQVTAPEGGLKPGDVVVVNKIDLTIPNNFTQYEATKPTSDLLRTEDLAIVISGGNFEMTSDGRMASGNPNYATYIYQKGKTVPVLFLHPRVVFYLSDDCLASSATKNQYLYGQNNSNQLVANDSPSDLVLTMAKVMAKLPFRLGGQFGGEFATGNVCVVLDDADSIQQYKVYFDTDGGSEVPTQSVDSGAKATKPSNPTKTGYTFDDWYTTEEHTTKYDFDTPVTSSITIYANWVINTYTVEFDTNGGSTIADQTVNYNATATQPENPTKDGFTFSGWYADSELTQEFDFSTPIVQDITIYAKWTINTYTVEFDTDGGSTIENQTVDYNAKATRPEDPTKDGFTFGGWYADSELTQEFDFDTLITQNTTIYAKWTE